MEAEIAQKINDEIINKITNVLYCFSYTDEQPSEDVLVLRIEKTKVSVVFEIDVKKNFDRLISSCTITTGIKEENKKKKDNNGEE